MGEFSIWHWLIVLLVVMLLFGGGKISGMMGDLAKGIKSFKAVMAEDDAAKKPPAQPVAPPSLEAAVEAPVAQASAARASTAQASAAQAPAAAPAEPVAASPTTGETKTAARASVEHVS